MAKDGDESFIVRAFRTLRERGKLAAIEEDVVPAADHPDWSDEFEPSDASVRLSQRRLAEEYNDVPAYGITRPLFLLALLMVADFLLYVNAQVYGLSISLYGAVLMVFPDLKGRYVIATVAEGNSEAIRRLEARNTVFSNTAFALIAVGFLLQIAAVQMLAGPELMGWNALPLEIERWITGLAIAAVYIAFWKISQRSLSPSDWF